jgi:hypothetical protein
LTVGGPGSGKAIVPSPPTLPRAPSRRRLTQASDRFFTVVLLTSDNELWRRPE